VVDAEAAPEPEDFHRNTERAHDEMAESTNPAAEDSETNAEACHAVKEDAEARHAVVVVVAAAEEDDWD